MINNTLMKMKKLNKWMKKEWMEWKTSTVKKKLTKMIKWMMEWIKWMEKKMEIINK